MLRFRHPREDSPLRVEIPLPASLPPCLPASPCLGNSGGGAVGICCTVWRLFTRRQILRRDNGKVLSLVCYAIPGDLARNLFEKICSDSTAKLTCNRLPSSTPHLLSTYYTCYIQYTELTSANSLPKYITMADLTFSLNSGAKIPAIGYGKSSPDPRPFSGSYCTMVTQKKQILTFPRHMASRARRSSRRCLPRAQSWLPSPGLCILLRQRGRSRPGPCARHQRGRCEARRCLFGD